MIEIGVFHNGASDLPVKITADGVAINDGDLRATQESAARVQINQMRQGILADRLGFDYFFLTEHHFQPEGAEYSPNPLLRPRRRSPRRPSGSASGRPPTSSPGTTRSASPSRPPCST